jgi:hypothetical protein
MDKFKWLALAPLFVAALSAQEKTSETQKVVFENDLVRVLDIRVPAGVFEPMHSHRRGVTIALSDYDNQTKAVGDTKEKGGHTKFGEVKWVEPVTHEARNTGSSEQHVVRVELKKDTPPAGPFQPGPLDALIVCGDTQKLLLENAWVRVIEDRSPAGSVAAKHTHQHGLLVVLADYDSEVKSFPEGKVSRSHSPKGTVTWNEPVTHEVKNTGKTESYLVRVELK